MATFDREAAKAAGYSDAEIDSFLASRGGGSPAAVGTTGSRPSGPMSPAQVLESESEAAQSWRVFKESLPMLGATAATAFAPATGGASAALPWIARSLLAAGGGMAGEAGREAVSREPFSMSRIGLAGGEQAGAQLLGEGLAGGGQVLAHGLMGRALAPRLRASRSEVANESRLAGERLAPDEATLAAKALKERVAVGPGPGGTGSKKLAEKAGELNKALDSVLDQAGKQGARAHAQTFMSEIGALRQELAQLGDPKLIEALNARQRIFIESFRLAGKKGAQGSLTRWTPTEVRKLVQEWSKEAKPLLDKRAQGTPLKPSELAKARFYESIARSGRKWLRDLTPSPVPGQPGAVEQLNNEMSRLMPLEDAVTLAEFPRVREPGFGGFMRGLLEHPRLESRAALGLTEPVTQDALRTVPRVADYGLHLLGSRRERKP